MGKCCHNCEHWNSVNSECRRYPPQVVVEHERVYNTLAYRWTNPYPTNPHSYYCGEYSESKKM